MEQMVVVSKVRIILQLQQGVSTQELGRVLGEYNATHPRNQIRKVFVGDRMLHNLQRQRRVQPGQGMRPHGMPPPHSADLQC